MIVTPDDQASKWRSDAKVDTDEPPPSYSSQPDASNGTVPAHTFKTQPTNFLALSNEHNSIKGEFVIDPCIRIPAPMLPPLGEHESEADRKNLYLRSNYSAVHADIWLLGPRDNAVGEQKARRTTIALVAEHGSIHAHVRTLDGAVPFALTANSEHGTVRLAIPRSFQGLLSLSTRHGSVSVSDAIVENATQLSQVGDTRRYFVGDFALLGEDEWRGDQVEIEGVHGSMRVKYVDEAEGQGKKGLLSRLFGK